MAQVPASTFSEQYLFHFQKDVYTDFANQYDRSTFNTNINVYVVLFVEPNVSLRNTRCQAPLAEFVLTVLALAKFSSSCLMCRKSIHVWDCSVMYV